MNNTNNSIHVLPTETYFTMIRQLLADQGQAFIRVTGDSMRPLLHHLRDGVVIRPPDNIRIGDIVLFDRLNGRYALHRVIGKHKTGFSMAGDNQWFIEKNLPYGQIVGVVTSIERNGHRIICSNIFFRIYSLITAVLATPRVCIFHVLRKFYRKVRKLQ